jgi:hypothetical protein
MKKPTSNLKTVDHLPPKDQPKDAQPEPGSHTPENSIIHNGSADAFGATEEVRDDEDSDEDNDDFDRDYK